MSFGYTTYVSVVLPQFKAISKAGFISINEYSFSTFICKTTSLKAQHILNNRRKTVHFAKLLFRIRIMRA